jgi:hypothetical protein
MVLKIYMKSDKTLLFYMVKQIHDQISKAIIIIFLFTEWILTNYVSAIL